MKDYKERSYDRVQNELKENIDVTEENDQSPVEKKEATGPETKYGVVANAPNVNLRRTPEFRDDNVVTVLQEGTKVEILQSDNREFKKVKTDSHTGFISSEFVKEV